MKYIIVLCLLLIVQSNLYAKKKSIKISQAIVRGVVVSAMLTSAIEYEDENIEFFTDSDIARKIFSICKVGDYCEIIGYVESDFFTGIKSVCKINKGI